MLISGSGSWWQELTQKQIAQETAAQITTVVIGVLPPLTPYTLHGIPYTSHSAPYTLNSTSCTLNPQSNTLNPKLACCPTENPTPYTLHFTLYTLHHSLHPQPSILTSLPTPSTLYSDTLNPQLESFNRNSETQPPPQIGHHAVGDS